jgi:hypothetical protein
MLAIYCFSYIVKVQLAIIDRSGMNLKELTNRYSGKKYIEFLGLIREFIECELQLYIGDTHLRSWSEEAMRQQAQEIAQKLRAPPWQLTIEELEYLCDNAEDIIKELD